MKFPTISDVAEHLRDINQNKIRAEDGEIDVRLCVDTDETWTVRWGLVDFDPEHSAYCGASSVPGSGKRFNSRIVAKDLIEQCKDQRAESGDDDAEG